jgi:RNA polymerase sigma-70 factor (ECF subfamily)
MPTDDSFADLMVRLCASDDDAAVQIFSRFTHRLIALARIHLDGRIRQKVDPEDVVQSAYKSFFVRFADGQFDLASWDSLWGLLTVITVRKCGRWRERFHTEQRNLNAEVSMQSAADSGTGWEAVARDPSPEEAVMLAELVERLLRDQAKNDSAIITLALQGYSAPEICARLSRSERTVYRVLERTRKRLRRLCADEEERD